VFAFISSILLTVPDSSFGLGELAGVAEVTVPAQTGVLLGLIVFRRIRMGPGHAGCGPPGGGGRGLDSAAVEFLTLQNRLLGVSV
jgi:hypothetical protein